MSINSTKLDDAYLDKYVSYSSDIEDYVKSQAGQLCAYVRQYVADRVPVAVSACIEARVPGMVSSYVSERVPGIISAYVHGHVPGMALSAAQEYVAGNVPGMISGAVGQYVEQQAWTIVRDYVENEVPSMVMDIMRSYVREYVGNFLSGVTVDGSGATELPIELVALSVYAAIGAAVSSFGGEVYINSPAATYEVKFFDWDDAFLERQFVREGRSAAPPSPSRQRHRFGGWDGGDWTSVSCDLELTAVYERTECLVAFRYGEGLVLNKEVVVAVDGDATSEAPSGESVPYGMRFAGWSDDVSRVTGDMDVSAAYEAVQRYMVTFLVDGQEYAASSVFEGQTAVPPEQPPKEGYNISCWEPTYRNVTADVSSNALYDPQAYVVALDPAGGSVDPMEIDVRFERPYGELPEPYREGFRFVRWYDSGGRGVTEDAVVTAMSDHTLSAEWSEIIPVWTVRFVDVWGEEAEVLGQVSVENRSGVKQGEFPEAPSREGYMFAGWNPDGSNVTYDVDLSTVYEELDPDEVEVTFDPRGGEVPGGVLRKRATVGQPYGELPAAELSDMLFDGWWTEPAEGGEMATPDTIVSISENHTLYAKWQREDSPMSEEEAREEAEAVEQALRLDPEDEGEISAGGYGYEEPAWDPGFMFNVDQDQPETLQHEYEQFQVGDDFMPGSPEDVAAFVRMITEGEQITSGEEG